MSDSEYDRLRAVSPEDADLMEAAFSRDSWAPLARRLRELLEDKRRMNWLEMSAHERGGILLHNGSETGRNGLGLRGRSLRDALDNVLGKSGAIP